MNNRLPPQSLSIQSIRRFSFISLAFLSFLAVLSLGFVYSVSPLRDPAFEREGANAQTLVPWLQNVYEHHWIIGAIILAVLLATNFTVLLWGLSLRPVSGHGDLASMKFSRLPTRVLRFLLWLSIGLILFCMIFYGLFYFLLLQWVID